MVVTQILYIKYGISFVVRSWWCPSFFMYLQYYSTVQFDGAGNRTQDLPLFCWTAIKQTKNQLSQVRTWLSWFFVCLIAVQHSVVHVQ